MKRPLSQGKLNLKRDCVKPLCEMTCVSLNWIRSARSLLRTIHLIWLELKMKITLDSDCIRQLLLSSLLLCLILSAGMEKYCISISKDSRWKRVLRAACVASLCISTRSSAVTAHSYKCWNEKMDRNETLCFSKIVKGFVLMTLV